MYISYTDHAGLEILIHLSIASPFSRQIAIGNAGPATALHLWEKNGLFAAIF